MTMRVEQRCIIPVDRIIPSMSSAKCSIPVDSPPTYKTSLARRLCTLHVGQELQKLFDCSSKPARTSPQCLTIGGERLFIMPATQFPCHAHIRSKLSFKLIHVCPWSQTMREKRRCHCSANVIVQDSMQPWQTREAMCMTQC